MQCSVKALGEYSLSEILRMKNSVEYVSVDIFISQRLRLWISFEFVEFDSRLSLETAEHFGCGVILVNQKKAGEDYVDLL